MIKNFQFKNICLDENSINQDEGKLIGVSLISTPEAKGHNVLLDEKSIESFYDAVQGKTIKAYYTHSAQNDALDSIGLWSNFRIVKDEEYTKLLGDFEALSAWKENNPKDYEMLFELAKKAPEAFGVSAEFESRVIYYNEDGEEVEYAQDEEVEQEIYARAVNVSAFSIVASPAANPTGLFAEEKKTETLAKPLLKLQEKNDKLEMELSTSNKSLEIYSEKLSESEAKILTLETEIKDLEKSMSELKNKFADTITSLGSDPVFVQEVQAPKTFDEQLAQCNSWQEKNNLIKQNMSQLMSNWKR